MAEFNQNLWAPWRMEYIRSLAEEAKQDGCFLCNYWQNAKSDRENHVVWRAGSTFVVMNRFPYTNGHLLIANGQHKGEFSDLSSDELGQLTLAIRDAVELLRRTISPHGFNIGYNLGLCAGAGLPDHLHAHIVPRWSGDTNFMTVLDNSRVVPESLDSLWEMLVEQVKEMGLLKVEG